MAGLRREVEGLRKEVEGLRREMVAWRREVAGRQDWNLRHQQVCVRKHLELHCNNNICAGGGSIGLAAKIL